MTRIAPRAPKGMCGLPLFAGFPFTAGAAPFPCGALPARGGPPNRPARREPSPVRGGGSSNRGADASAFPAFPPFVGFFHRKWLMFYFLKAFTPTHGGSSLHCPIQKSWEGPSPHLRGFSCYSKKAVAACPALPRSRGFSFSIPFLRIRIFGSPPCSRDSPMPAIFHVQQAAGPERLARFRHDGSVPPERAVL